MKIFRLPDGHILQLADEAKIKTWNAEMPLIFIGNIKEKRLPQYRKEYPKAVVKEIEDYLDGILENVAIPKLINTLQYGKAEEKLIVAENIQALSESNPDQLKIAIPHIQTAVGDKDKQVAKLMGSALNNYQKAQKRKQTVKKRKILTNLRKQMDKVDIDFAEGKISDSDYITQQKEYLKLKREIELEEEV
jgi:hypothetical protein